MISKSYKYFFLLTFFIIISCQSRIEENIIKKEIMVKILIDLHLAEKAIGELNYDNDTLKSLYSIKEKEIFDRYSISEEFYRKSYSHYFFDPKELDEVYATLIDSLLLYQQIKANEQFK